MIDSLFDKKTAKQLDKIAVRKAQLERDEQEFVDNFMRTTSSDTITSVLDIVDAFGHPEEKVLSHEFREKYDHGQRLCLDDIMTLDSLFKSNYQNYSNKGDGNE